MNAPATLPPCPHDDFSPDQAAAWSNVAALVAARGVDLVEKTAGRSKAGTGQLAVLGKAGSGKTHLLARLVKDLEAAGVVLAGPEEGKLKPGRRTLAIVTPTNKAASVLRQRGVPATTLHRMLYRPQFHPDYQHVVDWLTGERSDQPGEIDAALLERARQSYAAHASVVGALAVAGLRGSDFITGWTPRKDPLDIGFVDEGSMLAESHLTDLKSLFKTLVMFGDPAQLAPVRGGAMVFDTLPAPSIIRLSRVHRQAADSPILDLAHALGEADLSFAAFEQMVEDAAARDPRVVVASRVDADLMPRSPVLVWRNDTRMRLIRAFRTAFEAPGDQLLPGEPLVCDGIELPAKHQNRRVELEARGLIRGAQTIYMGPGKRSGFAKLHVIGTEDPVVSCRAIVRIESPDQGEPFMPFVAKMGATFVHGAALTIHKAQGSQWENVQVFAPDLRAAARSGLADGGMPLWKRLAYVALTRAEQRLIWVLQPRLSRPADPLQTDDLRPPRRAASLAA
ncbi:AAA family ATPase [Acuticoccus sp. MNP-M23]|uniref:AAA family ATPase n=1 Tax=Acuticoccus sp. MNP-M23 TaxID=3072793 RepID=UPI0028167097|nr:AAA family ATPase [Acuticoccus sp. MNP-M23]WMS44604.1 AAA family ATPase [Acuticoccus sp. MNP-M23]